jgi:hypothetical protein
MSDAKLMSAVASRVAAGSDRVSPPALRMDTSLSSPTPPSTVWRASPCPHSPNVRAKSSAASACRSGVPERAAIRHSRNIVRRHITTIFQREPGFCQPKLHYRLPRHQAVHTNFKLVMVGVDHVEPLMGYRNQASRWHRRYRARPMAGSTGSSPIARSTIALTAFVSVVRA